MMKYAILLTALFVSTLANPMFPFLGRQNRYPNNMDQDDGVQAGAQQGTGVQQQGGTGNNEFGDTPDDDVAQQGTGGQQQGTGNNEYGGTPDDSGEMGGPGVAPQAGTALPGGDSSSGSSEEDVGSEAGGAGATLAPGGPIVGQDPNAPQTGADNAGQSSDGDVNIVRQVEAGPMIADPGNTSGQQDPLANALNLAPQAMKQQKSRRSTTAIAATTMILVAGVAATVAVTYKYKDAITARMGL